MTAEHPVRIVQVSPSDTGGGAEHVAVDLHRGGLARGLDSLLAVGFRHGEVPASIEIPNDAERSGWARAVGSLQPKLPRYPAEPSTGALVVRRGLKIVAEPGRALRRAQGYEDFDYPGTARLLELRGSRPDVVHLHNLHGGYFDLRRLPELSASVPTAVTLHDTWLMSGHCAYSLECERWRTGCGQCPHLDTHPAMPRDRTAQNWQLKRELLAASRLHVVAPSRWILDRAADSILADGALDMRLIPNGVDQSVFAPADRAAARAELDLPADPLMIVFNAAARRNLYKDVATLAAALPAIVARVAPRPLLLVSLGAWVGDAGVPGAQVVSVPFLAEARGVARYLAAADLSIHTAHAENHPLAILEAQSCGLPVVATNIGGIPETLVDGETGVLVPPDDAEALAAVASALLLDDARRGAMARAAAAHAAGRFGLERVLDDYVALYHEIAADAKPPAG